MLPAWTIFWSSSFSWMLYLQFFQYVHKYLKVCSQQQYWGQLKWELLVCEYHLQVWTVYVCSQAINWPDWLHTCKWILYELPLNWYGFVHTLRTENLLFPVLCSIGNFPTDLETFHFRLCNCIYYGSPLQWWTFHYLSSKSWYLQHNCAGDTIVYH